MPDLLPANGASACNLPDPQAKEPAVITYCAYCDEPFYSGYEVVRNGDGMFFCDEECYLHWVIREGGADYVVISEDGNHVMRVVGR
jgi:thioredoxin reductase